MSSKNYGNFGMTDMNEIFLNIIRLHEKIYKLLMFIKKTIFAIIEYIISEDK